LPRAGVNHDAVPHACMHACSASEVVNCVLALQATLPPGQCMVASVMMAEKIQEDRVVTEYHGLRGSFLAAELGRVLMGDSVTVLPLHRRHSRRVPHYGT
jgi:hypothetical protein